MKRLQLIRHYGAECKTSNTMLVIFRTRHYCLIWLK